MASERTRPVDRRTVLKTLGATAVAAVGASSTVSADHVQPGDQVRITPAYDIASYERACDHDLGPVYEAGTMGLVNDVRDCYYRGRMVEFQPMEFGAPTESGWVEDTYVESYP